MDIITTYVTIKVYQELLGLIIAGLAVIVSIIIAIISIWRDR